MKVLYDDRALADRRRDALHGVGPDVADRKDAGNARLVVRPRLDEAPLVALDLWRQPLGPRLGPNEYEEAVRRDGLVPSGARNVTCSSRPSPPASTTSVLSRTRTFSLPPISSRRYCDMLDESDEPRQTSVTLAAYRARCNAACRPSSRRRRRTRFPP